MKWALNAENMRINAEDLTQYDISLHSLRLPCCLTPAIYVRGTESNSRAFFRHQNKCMCPYAISTEYNMNLHWEIIDSLETICENSKKRHRFLRQIMTIPWWIKLGLFNSSDFLREFILTYKNHVKRADVKFGSYVFEIQCSYLQEAEMTLREQVYRSHGLRTLWIIGIPEEKELRTLISFPHEAPKFIQKRFRQQIRQNRRYLLKSMHNIYDFDGIALEKWRVKLMKSHRIFAIYFRGEFYTNFHIFTILSHIPKIQFEHACRKVDILHLVDLKER